MSERQQLRAMFRRGKADLNDLDGPLDVDAGGTGASASSDARTNLQLGSMSTQNANAVAITGGAVASTALVSLANVTVPKTSGVGIKVDTATPTFPWHDLLGEIRVVTTAVSTAVPSWVTYKGVIRQFQFGTSDAVQNVFHIPHDYVPGTELYLHVHWSHNLTSIATGDVTWQFEMSYAKGHDQQAFLTNRTKSVTQNASTKQYQHMIAETVITGVAGSTSVLPTTDIEPDGLLLVVTELLAHTLPGTALPFGHFVDVHYQSVGVGTKDKAPPFWG